MNDLVIKIGHELCVEFTDKIKGLMIDELKRQLKKITSQAEQQEITDTFSSEYHQILEHVDIIEMCIKVIAE